MNPSVHTDDARFLELLERWLTGEFNRSDEGELHALTAADPFRREAWEGFISLPEAQHQIQLERLRQRLQPPRGRQIPLSRWMAAAAVFLLLLAAFYFIPNWQGAGENLSSKQDTAATPAPDTLAAPVSPAADLVVSENTRPANPSSSAKAAPSNRNLFEADPVAEEVQADRAISETSKKLPTAFPSGTAKPRSDSNPISIGGPEGNLQTIPTQYPEIGGPASNMNSRRDTPAATTAFNLPEVQTKVESQPVGRQADAPAAEARKKSAPAAKEMVIIQPVGGWQQFHDFMTRNARLPEAAKNNNVSGKVRLQFNVDSLGKPIDIKAIERLGYGCEEEATRLLSLFQWEPKGAGPAFVDILFVR